MVKFETLTLKNGMVIIVNEDKNTPLVQFNLVYNVGAKDENPEKTGFAHLFEHLMFEGSENIKSLDSLIEGAGGYLNAWTSQDMTNYYEVLPKENIETAFWVESDRMQTLDINPKTLEQERKIVSEEFKQSYLNKPYGDVWKLILENSYTTHPYKWPTIGMSLEHIQNFVLDDVKAFYKNFYAPNNAVLGISGNIKAADMFKLAEKWFGDIPTSELKKRKIPKEPKHTKQNRLEVTRDVPQNTIYLSFNSEKYIDPKYLVSDLITSILSSGESSRLDQSLVRDKRLFTSVGSYVTGHSDPGLVYFTGSIADGVSMKQAEDALWEEINKIKNSETTRRELDKIKNMNIFGVENNNLSIHEKALDLAINYIEGDVNRINELTERFEAIKLNDISKHANELFTEENSTVIYYHANKDGK